MLATRTHGQIGRAERYRALADPTRLRILELLRAGERCVCELTEALELGQSLLSFHLRTLKEAGLVTYRREGRWAYYVIEAGTLREMAAGLARLAAPPGPPARVRRRCN